MLHILSIEFLKLKKSRQFIILLATMALAVAGTGYIVNRITQNLPPEAVSWMQSWKWILFFGGFLFVMPAMIVIMHTCSEYTYRTNRQNIIDGLTRHEYVTAKIMLVVGLALLTTILVFSSALAFGLFPVSSFSFENFKYLFYYFLQALLYLGFAFLLALIIKRSILALSIYVSYSLIVENILEYKYVSICDLLPLASSDNLIQMKQELSIITKFDVKPEAVYLTFTCVYIALCYAACYFRYGKQDL